MKLISKLAHKNKSSLIILSITSLISGVLNAIFLAIITYSLSGDVSTAYAGIFFLLTCLGVLAIRHGHRYVATLVSNEITHQLRSELANIIRRCETTLLERKGESALLTVLTEDINTLTAFILSIPPLLSNMTFLIGALVYLIYISDFYLFASMIVVAGAAIYLYAYVMAVANSYFGKTRAQQERIVGHFNDLVSGYKEIKIRPLIGEKLISNYIEKTSTSISHYRMAASIKNSFGLSFGQAAIYLLIGSVIFIFPSFVGHDSTLLFGYVIAIIYASGPLESIISSYPQYIRAKISLNKIEELEEELGEAQENANKSDVLEEIINDVSNTLKLVDVEFVYSNEYNNGAKVGPFNFHINSGEVVFVVGGNGDGKTTLAKLLCGLYTPTAGKIFLNDIPISQDNIQYLRDQYSTVFSNFHLINNSPGLYDLEKIKSDDLVSEFGLDDILSNVGETELHGKELSQGQRRRLALLLSFVDSNKVHLFDEPGSDLDPSFKRHFYRVMIPRLQSMGKTVLVITHDDNYFDVADRVIRLRSGKIVSDTYKSKELNDKEKDWEGKICADPVL